MEIQIFPFIFFIHGGSFEDGDCYTLGTGDVPLYNSHHLAIKGDVIVVSTNYRLRHFGFLALEELKKE